MLLRTPLYCKDFKCIADKCSDNCCIGWEIDIDEKTANYYRTLDGEFGDRLRNSIDFGETVCFKLKNERCQFLNEQNLCEVLLTLGEDKLSEICTKHPRYYEWFDGVIEGGVGMCCEEAARLILAHGDTEEYAETEVPDEDCDHYDHVLYEQLLIARKNISDVIRDTSIPLKTAVSSVLAYAERVQSAIDNFEENLPEMTVLQSHSATPADIDAVLDILYELEPIDEKWKPFVLEIKGKPREKKYISKEYEKYIRNIGLYFIWRYFMKGVFDEEILSKVKFSVISMAVMGYIFTAENADFGKSVILAKNYSKEIEYSEENLNTIYDLTYENEAFSSEKLVGLF